MIAEEEIKSLAETIGKKLIGKEVFKWNDLSYDEKKNIDSYYKDIPDLNSIYVESIKHRNEVAIHAIKGTFPYDLLKTKAPNQSDKEWEYQKGIYKSYTFRAWGRAENKTKIIGNTQNYSISGWDDEQKKYFFTNYPAYHSLPAYFFDIVRKKKINFPNQVLLIRPEYLPIKETADGPIIDQSIPIPYIVDIIDEFKVAAYKEGKYLLSICEEMVLINDRKFYQFDFYDDMNIYKVIPIGYTDNVLKYEVVFILQHGWGYLPAQKLKGEIQDCIKGNDLYNSIFSFAIPDLDDAIRLSSNLSMSEYNAAFPTRIRVVDKCTYSDPELNTPCINGRMFKSGKFEQCPSCMGTGTDSSISPTGEIQVKMYSSHLAGAATQLPMSPPMTYVAPPVDIYIHLDLRIKAKMDGAFAFMFKSDNADAGTATGEQLEKEEFYSSLVQFSNELFNLMKFSIEALGFFMFTKEQSKIGKSGAFVMPEISNPTYFNFRNASDITKEITEARLGGLPEPYILQLLKEYGMTRFNNDEDVDKFTDFWVYCDRLWNKDEATIRILLNVTVSPIESIIHSSFTSMVEQAVIDNKDFWDKEPEDRKQIIVDMATEIADLLKVEPPILGADAMVK